MSAPGQQQWERVKALFEAAVALPPESRASFLASLGATDEDLRSAVARLLAAHDEAESFLETPPALPATEAVFSPDLVGRLIGPYQVVSRIGVGGMGEVYKARDTRLDRSVAIKVLPASIAQDGNARERFEREARAVAAISHPHICVLHDVGHADGLDFLVMEHVPGETLSARLAGGALPLAQVLDYGIQIAKALAAAHAIGILHRDIKPSNLIVTADGHVKVLDFGLAKPTLVPEAVETRRELTASGIVVGTLAYMSPEQARGEIVDARTDLFSLGAVLYELATGRQAFTRAFDWTRPPAAGLPPGFQQIVFTLLEQDPQRRYQTATALVEDLTKLQQTTGSKGSQARRLVWAAAAIALVATIVTLAVLTLRQQPGPPNPGEWVQLTRFPDAVSTPALSPDGRTLAFIRGQGTFNDPGELYVKLLPDGEAVQLTRDGLPKSAPVFSPDGSRLVYTATEGTAWDSWVVPMPGGKPRRWLPNASGLMFGPGNRLLFAEIKDGDIHMGIVMSDQDRAGTRDLYLPAGTRDMAHQAVPSPDGKWALVTEMTRGDWLPCRLLSLDGSAPSRQVGSPKAACTSAAWSPDGRWMYLTTNATGSFQVSRQAFPDGRLEQLTSGPTEAEGSAIAPDGRSFITAVAQRQSVIVVGGAGGERQISSEGYAFDASFTPDGRSVLYRALQSGFSSFATGLSQLRRIDLESGNDELLLDLSISGRPALMYDISPDGKLVAVAPADHRNEPIWLVSLDRSAAARPIPNARGSRPIFGAAGDLFFDVSDPGGTWSHIYKIALDGSGLAKVIEQPVVGLRGISPDRRWLIVRLRDQQSTMVAFDVRGGPPVKLAAGDLNSYQWEWSPDGRRLAISGPDVGRDGHTYTIPLEAGRIFPEIPAGGFRTIDEIAKIPGARRIEYGDAVPADGDAYVFSRRSVQRNLYRIPIR